MTRSALTVRNNTPESLPSVFKSLANLKRSESMSEQDELISIDVKDAYFKSKKMRGAPQISPISKKKYVTVKKQNKDLNLVENPLLKADVDDAGANL